jgi:hypothetical protein
MEVAERRELSIGAGSVAEKGGGGKAVFGGKSLAAPADQRGRLSPHNAFAAKFLWLEQKSGPIAGATFQEVRFGRLSGKAMEVTVSLGGTALRELVTGNESEGHFFGFAAS